LNKLNLGCGPDVISGWTNVDIVKTDPSVEYWDAVLNVVPENWKNKFDFILINHVLCTMPYNSVRVVLRKVMEMLKDGGRVQIIDVNLRKAIEDWRLNDCENIPITGGTPDWKLCMHLSGYSTRLSLFTPNVLYTLLKEAGFSEGNIWDAGDSEYDLRPLESLVVEATK